MTGPMEKVNRRTLSHLSSLASDLSEMGARYNAFALSEPAPTLAPAIERIGQAADSSYIATEELSSTLGASFAEPMRENAQFAGVIRNVLRYRILKRVQQEMTNEELNKKRQLLDQLERSEAEARRIEQYLASTTQVAPPPRRSSREAPTSGHRREGSVSGGAGAEDTASIDSDFPPTHGDFSSAPSASIGVPPAPPPAPTHRKAPSAASITNRIFGPLRHAVQGVVDADPEKTRRDTITRTREQIAQLEQAQIASAQDVKDASASVLKDLRRFQREKEEDLRRYMVSFSSPACDFFFGFPVRDHKLTIGSSPTQRARSSGRRRTRRPGRRPGLRLRRLTSRRLHSSTSGSERAALCIHNVYRAERNLHELPQYISTGHGFMAAQ